MKFKIPVQVFTIEDYIRDNTYKDAIMCHKESVFCELHDFIKVEWGRHRVVDFKVIGLVERGHMITILIKRMDNEIQE